MLTEHEKPKDVVDDDSFEDRKTIGTIELTESPFISFKTEEVRFYTKEGELYVQGTHRISDVESAILALRIAPVEGSSSGELGRSDVPYAFYIHRNNTAWSTYGSDSGSFTAYYDSVKQQLNGNASFTSTREPGRAFTFNFNVAGFDTLNVA